MTRVVVVSGEWCVLWRVAPLLLLYPLSRQLILLASCVSIWHVHGYKTFKSRSSRSSPSAERGSLYLPEHCCTSDSRRRHSVRVTPSAAVEKRTICTVKCGTRVRQI